MPRTRLPSPMFMLLAVALLLFVLSSCSPGNSATATTTESRPIPVRATAVQELNVAESLRFAGVARARQRATLTFQVGGVLQSRAAELGQRVSEGQILATLYNPQLEPSRDAARSRLEQLRTDAAQAARDLDRIRQLHERGATPFQDLEQQQARVESLLAAISNAEASLQQAEQLLAEAELRAPFAGTIEAVLLEPGEFAQAGQAILRIAAQDGTEVEVRVPAQLLDHLSAGSTIDVIATLSGQQLVGRVLEIGQGSSAGSALYPLVVSVDNPGIRSGDAMEVAIPRQREPALVVPMSAVMRSADGLSVFRISNDTVSRVPIQLSHLLGDLAVISGNTLSNGDSVVYAGITRLADGDRVEVLQ